MVKFRLPKGLFLQIFLCFNILIGFAQRNPIEVTHYVFPEFTKGIVLMKTGIRNESLLNYNSLTKEMIFLKNTTKLALGQLETIDTVYILNRKFIPQHDHFIELIYKSKYSLFVDHKCKLKDPGKPAGYGGTSQTSAISTYSTFFSGGRAYEMKLPEGYETQSSVEYWLDKDGKMNKFLSIRQLSKLFDEKESLFKAYTKKNDVDYDNQNSIVELLKYLQAN